ncbi:hypothetical protein E9993_21010 [Labilibacter sediminis]|nr:hypothetical protein E9993_21010 [Labilibacter sediminis]
MARIKIVVLVLFAFSLKAYSQDYMDVIAEKACECLSNIPDTLDEDRFNLELGLCMIEAATPYKKQLKKDYKIDMAKIDTQGEELGRIIGMKIAVVCPDALLKLVNKVGVTEEEEITKNCFVGEVTSIQESQFIVFSVKNEEGRLTKFYWLTFVDSDIEMTSSYQSLKNEKVSIDFVEQEFFDSRIGEYRTFNIIQKLEQL